MKPDSIRKYRPFPAVTLTERTWPDRVITEAPIWCSVDLRDGNQALPVPMTVEEKLEMFDLLVRVGFKEIEIGFPSASDTEFAFMRRLIDEDRIPEDVTVQVLVQTRRHLIERTFEAIKGARRAVVHIYNSTSTLQRRVTFGDASREDIKAIAVTGAEVVKELVPTIPETEVVLQYSPESFSDTELDFALECCEAVIEVWEPTPEKKLILNLPATVEWTTPNVHADQIEWMCRNVSKRDAVIISLHTHNDRGTGVAATELGLMAGADRVEGTLFGNGERTGNLDIVIAIKKGLDRRAKEEGEKWGVPYLTIDPHDIGRSYEAIVRINSQSGKGGVAYIIDQEHGYDLPKTMHPQVGKRVYDLADQRGEELSSEEVGKVFFEEFVNVSSEMELEDYELDHGSGGRGEVACRGVISKGGERVSVAGLGNGPINAFVHGLEKAGLKDFTLSDYRSHAVRGGSSSDAAAYVQLRKDDGSILWGVGVDPSIEMAGVKALVCAWNLLR